MDSSSNDSNICRDDERYSGLNHFFSENIPRVSNLGRKTKGANWTDEETQAFLNLCIEKSILQKMDGKRCKHIEIYESLEPMMKKMGFIKTGAQMKTKWKHLKELYIKCKRNNNLSNPSRLTFSFYKEMDQLLSGRPSVQAFISHGGINSSSSNIRRLTEEEVSKVENNNDNEQQNDTSPAKKKKTGRRSHIKLAENFAEVFVAKQAEEMSKVLNEQMRMFNELIHTQMETQRLWEKELIEKDHQHQTLMMEHFMKSLRAMQTADFHYTSSAQMLRPSSSLCSPIPSSPIPISSPAAPPLSSQTSQNTSHINTSIPPSPSNIS